MSGGGDAQGLARVSEIWQPPLRARWTDGPIARAVDANLKGRLSTFIRDRESEPLAFFSAEWRAGETSGDWYGEHAGKWLLAACAAFVRTGSPEIGRAIEEAVAALLKDQEPNGYLGTYASDSSSRFTDPHASGARTWDLWTHAWTILGLLEVGRVREDDAPIAAARRAGDLILASFPEGERSVLDLGNHAGLSSAVLIEPLARLTLATGEPLYAAFARRIVAEMEARGLRVLSDAGGDPATMGTGKIYQFLWVLLGLTALYRVTGEEALLEATEDWAHAIAAFHLNPLGGPWGGLGGHKEVFAARGAFDPGGLVETCSTATWMALNRELALLTEDVRAIDRFERAFLNALLGAALANGEDWSYFTFANGRRTATYHWACCKSSGAMALETSALGMMSSRGNEIRIEVPLPGEATFLVDGREVTVVQEWTDRGERLTVRTAAPIALTLRLRVPYWARVAGGGTGESSGILEIAREFADGESIEIPWTVPLRVEPFTHSVDHHGQEVVRDDWAYVARGPWVYATGLLEGYRRQETLRLPRLDPSSPFRVTEESGEFGPKIELRLPTRTPIGFWPYAEAGGRTEGGWRGTWLGIAWQ